MGEPRHGIPQSYHRFPLLPVPFSKAASDVAELDQHEVIHISNSLIRELLQEGPHPVTALADLKRPTRPVRDAVMVVVVLTWGNTAIALGTPVDSSGPAMIALIHLDRPGVY